MRNESPSHDDDVLVVTSVRLPTGLHLRLKDYADERNTTPSVLIRGWVEQHMLTPGRVVSLDAVMSAIASIKPEQAA